MKTISLLTAIALSMGTSSAHADKIELSTALAGATLHESGVDMSVFWTRADKGFEVLATFVDADAEAPQRLQMLLADGDETSFSLPGNFSHRYTFARVGDTVTVEAINSQTFVASK